MTIKAVLPDEPGPTTAGSCDTLSAHRTLCHPGRAFHTAGLRSHACSCHGLTTDATPDAWECTQWHEDCLDSPHRLPAVEAYLQGQRHYRHRFEPTRNTEAVVPTQAQVDHSWSEAATTGVWQW